jgi:hypothetical protein
MFAQHCLVVVYQVLYSTTVILCTVYISTLTFAGLTAQTTHSIGQMSAQQQHDVGTFGPTSGRRLPSAECCLGVQADQRGEKTLTSRDLIGILQ